MEGREMIAKILLLLGVILLWIAMMMFICCPYGTPLASKPIPTVEAIKVGDIKYLTPKNPFDDWETVKMEVLEIKDGYIRYFSLLETNKTGE
jgi:hypothetical protein